MTHPTDPVATLIPSARAGRALYEQLRDWHNATIELADAHPESAWVVIFAKQRQLLEAYERSTCCATGRHEPTATP